VGIIVPEPSFIKEFALANEIEGDHEALCQNKAVRAYVLE